MPAGLPYRPGGYEGIGDTTLRRLTEGRDGALVADVDPDTDQHPRWGWSWSPNTHRATPTDRAGAGLLRQHAARYRTRYPDGRRPPSRR
jgi:hypothetical protein